MITETADSRFTEKATDAAAIKSDYCANLDVLRIVAVAAVVWIHAAQTSFFKAGVVWCRFAVPAFAATSIWLLLRRHGTDAAEDLKNYAVKRALKIYLLFLAWNCLFAGARAFEHAILKNGDAIRWNFETFLLAGFSEQLWFLPFLSVATLLTASVMVLAGRQGLHKWPVMLCLPAAGVLWALCPPPPVNLDTHPSTYWLFLSWQSFPSVMMTFGVFGLCQKEPVAA